MEKWDSIGKILWHGVGYVLLAMVILFVVVMVVGAASLLTDHFYKKWRGPRWRATVEIFRKGDFDLRETGNIKPSYKIERVFSERGEASDFVDVYWNANKPNEWASVKIEDC